MEKTVSLENQPFGIFTDDEEIIKELKEVKSVDLSKYTYGIAIPSKDPKYPYTCVNGTNNSNWRYFVSLYLSPLNYFS